MTLITSSQLPLFSFADATELLVAAYEENPATYLESRGLQGLELIDSVTTSDEWAVHLFRKSTRRWHHHCVAIHGINGTITTIQALASLFVTISGSISRVRQVVQRWQQTRRANIGLVVGHSQGGYFASRIATDLGCWGLTLNANQPATGPKIINLCTQLDLVASLPCNRANSQYRTVASGGHSCEDFRNRILEFDRRPTWQEILSIEPKNTTAIPEILRSGRRIRPVPSYFGRLKPLYQRRIRPSIPRATDPIMRVMGTHRFRLATALSAVTVSNAFDVLPERERELEDWSFADLTAAELCRFHRTQRRGRLAALKVQIWLNSSGQGLSGRVEARRAQTSDDWTLLTREVGAMPEGQVPAKMTFEWSAGRVRVRIEAGSRSYLRELRRLRQSVHSLGEEPLAIEQESGEKLRSDYLDFLHSFTQVQSPLSTENCFSGIAERAFFIPCVNDRIPLAFPKTLIDSVRDGMRRLVEHVDGWNTAWFVPLYDFRQTEPGGKWELLLKFNTLREEQMHSYLTLRVATIDKLTVDSFLNDSPSFFHDSECLLRLMYSGLVPRLGLPGSESVALDRSDLIAPADRRFPGFFRIWEQRLGEIDFDSSTFTREVARNLAQGRIPNALVREFDSPTIHLSPEIHRIFPSY